MTTFFKQFVETEKYPREVWVLFWSSLISMMAQSLVWPFLTIHIRQQLDLPLAEITLLFTLQSIASLIATAAFGPAVDRFGRKWAMVGSSFVSGAMLIGMIGATTLNMWAALLSVYAMAGVVFRLGANAMIADMIPPEDRIGAYALMRMGHNVGIAFGPAIGGFVIALSYSLSFFVAALGQVALAFSVIFLIKETLDRQLIQSQAAPISSLGYGPLLRDRLFMGFFIVTVLIEIGASLVFTLLGVYVKEQHSIPESQYGFILTTNAVMVVVFQYAITRITRQHRPFPVMAVSGIFYGLGMLLCALGNAFVVFWLGMVVMTIGELIISPTSTTLVADMAPPDMRGRYMGVYGMSYRIGGGVGPVMGGWLNDNVAPAAIWYFGMISSFLAAGGFLLLQRGQKSTRSEGAPLALPGESA